MLAPRLAGLFRGTNFHAVKYSLRWSKHEVLGRSSEEHNGLVKKLFCCLRLLDDGELPLDLLPELQPAGARIFLERRYW